MTGTSGLKPCFWLPHEKNDNGLTQAGATARTRGCSNHMQEVQQWSFPDAHGVQSLNSIRAQASNNPGEEQLSKKFYLIPKTCACSYQTEFVPEVRTTHASLHNSPLGLMCNMHILPEDLVPQTPH